MIRINSCTIPFSNSHTSLDIEGDTCRVILALDFPKSVFNASKPEVNISIIKSQLNIPVPIKQARSNELQHLIPNQQEDTVAENKSFADDTGPVSSYKNDKKRHLSSVSSQVKDVKNAKVGKIYANGNESSTTVSCHSVAAGKYEEDQTDAADVTKLSTSIDHEEEKKLMVSAPREPCAPMKPGRVSQCGCVVCEACDAMCKSAVRVHGNMKCPFCQCASGCLWKGFTRAQQRFGVMVRGKPGEDPPSTYGIITRALTDKDMYEVRYPVTVTKPTSDVAPVGDGPTAGKVMIVNTKNGNQVTFEQYMLTLQDIKPLICQVTTKDQYEALLTLCV